MTDLVTLLAKGYFPDELPPPFVTDSYAKVVVSNINNLPATFYSRKTKAKILPHSIARVDILRRKIGIPNPILFFNLSKEIISNFPSLASHYAHSSISASAPIFDARQRRAFWWTSDFKEHIPIRAKIRSTSKWILRTDISKFYPSIYTHSIPWALHGKIFSKSNTGNQYLGNSLDQWIRTSQDNQTVGVPVGPDTSLIISEIILSAVDVVLQQKLPKIKCLRIVDDYEFGCSSYAHAEETLSILQAALNEFELDINIEKTKIIKLPIPLEASWVSELRHFEIRDKAKTQFTDLIEYFSRVFELSNESPREAILKYAIKRLRNTEILSGDNWSILESFLLQSAVVEAGVIQPVLELLIDCNPHKYSYSFRLIEEVLNQIITLACPLGYTNEAAWALWGLIHWNLQLDAQSCNIVSDSNDSIIALLALDLQCRGLNAIPLDLSLWSSAMTTSDLYEKQWLLSYEANKKGWLPTYNNAPDHVVADPNFRILKANDVFFYDDKKFVSAKTFRNFPSGLWPLQSVTP